MKESLLVKLNNGEEVKKTIIKNENLKIIDQILEKSPFLEG